MFMGIIKEIGTVERVERKGGVTRLAIHAPKTAARIQPLESVAINGTCLTAVRVGQGALTFEIIQKTRGLTTVGALRPGERVNVEPSLSLADRIGGHILLGHVDGCGTVTRRSERAGELVLNIRVPEGVRRFLVPNGPVAVDGVSLTVGPRLAASTFSVHLIPETLRQTILRGAQPGQRVNVEVDYLAKLVRQIVGHSRNH